MRIQFFIRKGLMCLVSLLFLINFNLFSERVEYPRGEKKNLSETKLVSRERILIDALDADSWAGIVFATKEDSVFAFRFGIYYQGRIIDGRSVFYSISKVGPHSPDGTYAEVEFDAGVNIDVFSTREEIRALSPVDREDKEKFKDRTVLIQWTKIDPLTVIGKVKIPKNSSLLITAYFPWDYKGKYRYIRKSNVITGSSNISSGFSKFVISTSIRPSRYGQFDSFDSIYDAVKKDSPEKFIHKTREPSPFLTLMYDTKEERTLYFTAKIGKILQALIDESKKLTNINFINQNLERFKLSYEKNRVKTTGLFDQTAEALTNNLYWMTLYHPELKQTYIPAGRRWIFPDRDGKPMKWTIFEWDGFFNALEVSLESKKHAIDMLKAVLQTQYEDGNIPNWRGEVWGTNDRTQPPVGGYCTLKIFYRLNQDLKILKFAYPYLKKWHSFWKTVVETGYPRRDGNNDGLLEWGSENHKNIFNMEKAEGLQRAMWESGMDDSPLWDDTKYIEERWTLNMNCLDLSSLYALDALCLSEMAKHLGLKEDEEMYLREYENLKELINEVMWNEAEGFYFDKYWDGKFSSRKAASNFYPLLAGIVPEDKIKRMIKHLLNEKEFWGEYILPTISRDDPAFKDQQYWRGTIWPPTNYLVYQGLKRYRLDEIASEYAEKSAKLFIKSWRKYQLCRENYDSRTGEGGGQRYQSWGPLFSLIALEEFFDYEPWAGIRFGSLGIKERSTVFNLPYMNRKYDITIGPDITEVKEDGRLIFRANKDAVIRNFINEKSRMSFEIKINSNAKLEINRKGLQNVGVRKDDKTIFEKKFPEDLKIIKLEPGIYSIEIT
ncbi:MAG: trehalase family glycosidase [Acidobacteriota bacterium]